MLVNPRDFAERRILFNSRENPSVFLPDIEENFKIKQKNKRRIFFRRKTNSFGFDSVDFCQIFKSSSTLKIASPPLLYIYIIHLFSFVYLFFPLFIFYPEISSKWADWHSCIISPTLFRVFGGWLFPPPAVLQIPI